MNITRNNKLVLLSYLVKREFLFFSNPSGFGKNIRYLIIVILADNKQSQYCSFRKVTEMEEELKVLHNNLKSVEAQAEKVRMTQLEFLSIFSYYLFYDIFMNKFLCYFCVANILLFFDGLKKLVFQKSFVFLQ